MEKHPDWTCDPRENPYSCFIFTRALAGDPVMYALFAQLARLLKATPAAPGVAARLMESAVARAGTNPQQAEELRIAASAYLRVVR